jgi:hypothetical protein
MTDLGETTPSEPETELVGPGPGFGPAPGLGLRPGSGSEDAEAIAEAYEEEAALTNGPDDLPSLAVRVRKIEERLATIEDYLGTPPSKAGSLEERIEGLEGEL